MRKFSVIAAAAIVFAVLPFGAAAATHARAQAHWFAGSVTAASNRRCSLNTRT